MATLSQQAGVDCAVIIVTYNSARDILGLLESLPCAAADVTLQVVVVDNGSADATVELVSGRPDVMCVEVGANLGYAAGINIGRERVGDCASILVLNPDLVLEPGAIREMLGVLSDTSVGVVVPMLFDGDGHRCQSLRRRPTLARAIGDALFGHYFGRRPGWLSEVVRSKASYKQRHPVDWATGAAMLISADCDRSVGQWDERFFLYSEEVDYATRARAAGFRIEYLPTARARHRGGGSGQSADLVALMAVNRVRYMEKHRPRLRVYRAVVALHELLRSRDAAHRTALLAVIRRSRWPALLRADRPGRGAPTLTGGDGLDARSRMASTLLHRAVRTARTIRAIVATPPYVAPGDFYSPLTTQDDVSRALTWTEAPAVDMSEETQLALVSQLRSVLSQPALGPRYTPGNGMYGPGDAAVYRAMLHHLRPARIIEVGSGYSTALALDEADACAHLSKLAITCIEPFPDRLLSLLGKSDSERVTLIRQPVQDVAAEIYGTLGPGDVLFIDSTHVVKAGSDVVWLFLHVLPRLAPGVAVHVHDVFWPFEYPASWLKEHRDWTENYLLHAFLVGNASWEIMFFSSWIWHCHPELVPRELAREQPGSIWLRRLP
jgi:GT2 family glycosyltransferase